MLKFKLLILALFISIQPVFSGYPETVKETARDIPVIDSVDVVVVGGSTGGVSAAIAAAREGASVFLAGGATYLGDDMCSTYQLWLEDGEKPLNSLAEKIYAADETDESSGRYVTPRPMHVKRTLENALLNAGVRFLFSTYGCDLVFSEGGELVGVCIVNRSGRQVILCKTVIDATGNAAMARMAGVKVRAAADGKGEFKRVVLGGTAAVNENIVSSRALKSPHWQPRLEKVPETEGKAWKVGPPEDWDGNMIEYTLSLPMPDQSFESFAKAQQRARDATWSPDQFDASAQLYYVLQESIVCRKRLSGSFAADSVSLDCFRPENADNLYVLGGCADLERNLAKKLIRPVNLMLVGERIGRAAAKESSARVEIKMPEKADFLPQLPARGSNRGELREVLSGLRMTQAPQASIKSTERNIPVLGRYDVVVVGGGTGGAPAAISSARNGMKTLVVEYQNGLGGVSTLGMIGIYWYGNRAGFTAEIDEGVKSMGPKGQVPKYNYVDVWNAEYRMEWFRKEILEAGGEIWFNATGCGALVENDKTRGVIVATPHGRGVVLCDVVIDSTGSADIAIAAGADYNYTDAEHAAMQGTGLPYKDIHNTGKNTPWYTNTDYTFVNEADMLDVWRAFIGAREKFSEHYDLSTIIDSRERRRIVGDYELDPLDVINDRTFDDTINLSRSNFDSHGYTIHPFFMLKAPDKKAIEVRVPYRCLIPKALDNMLVTGLGISAHRDSIPLVRMQPDIQNQGYAAGAAAAMAVKAKCSVRDIDIRRLQMHLVGKGCIPAGILEEKESAPLTLEELEDKVAKVTENYEGLGHILERPQDSIPLLREAYRNAENDEEKLVYAHILGVMNDHFSADYLIEYVSQNPWDEGWNFTGMGQFGASMSYLDSVIIALGRTGDKRAIEPIIEKTRRLGGKSQFSHYRAVAVAFETLGDKRAARPLAELLGKEGMTGHTVTLDDIQSEERKYFTDRSLSLREIVLARALFRCGDYNGLGRKILEEYAKDLRGLYSRHAVSILRQNQD
ncbi:putative FAD-binding dehydrogenase [Limihaloglobus sulfuriphilus]|uniref:Putative FAD-binding dehydrogenase n=1 Tax=Limihaloglobus sulfuriphilus TaxID=1851148 RepID=A0A1Q2MAV2_9BACT|nr:FAD-dependent oxidoreductase [Limihaloglobus sulfuriphilus]AQQ69790.1 putative FAD-binding dehydrogenase [Limihaloglobus sulfuriphilus]